MATILIADDSMFQRFMHAKVAKNLGYEVLEAKDGNECLDLARASRPEVMLLDLNMPGHSGMDVLKTIRQEELPIEVLIITADIQDTTRQRCEDLGVAGVVTKPVDEQQLTDALANLSK